MPLLRSPAPALSDPPAGPDAQQLLAALHDAASEQRRGDAAEALAAHPEAAEALAAALAAEPSAAVRETIAAALVRHGTPAAAAGLAAAIASDAASIRALAGDALREMGTAALPAIEALLGQPDADCRILACGLLDAMPVLRARPMLRRLLAQDPDVNVGLAAVEALLRSGEAADGPALRAFADRFPDEPCVAFVVGMACRDLGAAGAA